MGFEKLFSVSAGQKVTEKDLYRVLVSSICSILLCMACLVQTTWAWFTVSIENTDNVIQIATVTTDIAVTNEKETIAPTDEGYKLENGEYTISVGLERSADENAQNSQQPVYVVMTVRYAQDQMEYRLFTLNDQESNQEHRLTVNADSAVVTFSVSCVKPAYECFDGSQPLVIEAEPQKAADAPSD